MDREKVLRYVELANVTQAAREAYKNRKTAEGQPNSHDEFLIREVEDAEPSRAEFRAGSTPGQQTNEGGKCQNRLDLANSEFVHYRFGDK